MDAPWRIQLLGAVRADLDGQTVTRFSTQKTAALLARLALFPRRAHSREELVDLLWPDADLDAGRNRLRVAIASLRRQLEPPSVPVGSVLIADRNFVRLNPIACRCDVVEFDAALAQAARAASPEAAQEALERAATLYHGELLPGFYDDWVLDERERLTALYEDLCERLPSIRPSASPNRVSPDALPETGRSQGAAPLLGVPLEFTRFFGRERECAGVVELLASPQMRLVTFTGPGGSGKTRLAVEVARRMAPSLDGPICFVPLADLTEAALIPAALANGLKLPRTADQDSLDPIVAALSDHPAALLVLDNFEHLVERGAPLVLSLLTRLPMLTCLVTSRRRLKLPGEREYTVPPLALPEAGETPEQIIQASSVQLFVDRAQAARPDFQLTRGNAAAVAAVCRKLEGIPLALELVASRALALTPSQMVERLEHRFSLLSVVRPAGGKRQRSLWAAMAWSYDLIPPPLQRFFAGLSVFRGGCTVEAAQAVCEEAQALEFLTQLRERSLAIVEEGDAGLRFRLLETLREFAGEQLCAEERRQIADRHADYFGALAETAAVGMVGPDQGHWLDVLDADRENLYAALSWLLSEEEGVERSLVLAGALWRFWAVRGYHGTGRRWLERVLARPGGSASARATAANGAGNLARKQGDYAVADALFTEALALRRAAGDTLGVASCLSNLGLVATHEGDYRRAREFHEQSLALRREAGDERAIALGLNFLAVTVHYQKDYPLARSLHEETLALCTALGDDNGRIMSLGNLGLLLQDAGDYVASARLHSEAMRLCVSLQDQDGVINCAEGLAQLACRQGDFPRSLRLYAATNTLRRKLGIPPPPQDAQLIDEVISSLRSALPEVEFARLWAEGETMTGPQVAAYALGDSPL